MNPVDGNVKGDCASSGTDGVVSGTATTSNGPLYGKGNGTEVAVGMSVAGSEVGVAAEASSKLQNSTTLMPEGAGYW